MKSLTEVFISAVELVEAEGRDLRHWTFKVGAAVAMVLAAAVLLAAGVLAVATAFFLLLNNAIGEIGACTIVGLLLVIGAGALGWTAQNMINRRL